MTPDTERAWTTQAMFLDLNGRRLFALFAEPKGPCRGAVLYLPAFAEEMNRFRWHVSVQARALAAQGYSCLLVDPHGTGESAGEIVDGDWTQWLADAADAGRWLCARTGQRLWLWGARTGALMVAELADALGKVSADVGVSAAGAIHPTPVATDVAGLLLWQPVLDGKLFLNQYLRLRIASQLVKDTERETSATIRDRLAAGEALEIAGYPLTGAMANSLGTRRLDMFSPKPGQQVVWIEMVAKAGQVLAPPSRELVDKWQACGADVRAEAIVCPFIWQVHERVDAPALQQASTALMEPPR